MKQRKEILTAIAVIVPSVFLAILLHGFFSCPEQLPPELENGEVLDHFTISDSTAVLYRSHDGRVFLLEYQTNWLLPRQELKEYTLIDTQPFHTAVTSALAAYPVTATWTALTLDNQPEIRLRWGGFCDAYGTEILLLLLAAIPILYVKPFRKKPQKEEKNHVERIHH